MSKKLELLTEKLKDERSKKVIFVAHCILNENSRYQGGATRKACAREVIERIYSKDISIIQIKCPERYAWGGLLRKYMWMPLESKGSILYKLKFLIFPLFMEYTKIKYRKIARETVAEIYDYVTSGFEVAGIVGIEASPSCGVHKTWDMSIAFDVLAEEKLEGLTGKGLNQKGLETIITNGQGLFMQELKKELRRKKISIDFYEHKTIAEFEEKKE